jgi:hypothetical protein
MAHASLQEWQQIDAAQQAMDAAERARRVAADLASGGAPNAAARAQRIQHNHAALQRAASRLEADNPGFAQTLHAGSAQKAQLTVGQDKGPVRLAILPLDATVFDGLSAADQQWLGQQEARFASDSEGLATRPNFALISFEAINFMNGHRTTTQIAEMLSDEYLVDIDQAWVDRLAGILEKQKVVK